MVRRNDISLAQAVLIVEDAKRLIAEGMSLFGASVECGVGYEWLRRRIEPGYAEKSNAKVRARLIHPSPSMTRVDANVRPSQSDLARRRAEIPKDTRDFTQRFCGDPLPGRSALDRRRA